MVPTYGSRLRDSLTHRLLLMGSSVAVAAVVGIDVRALGGTR